MPNSNVSGEELPYLPLEYGNTYHKVEHHPLVGHELTLQIVEVFENPDNHALLVKIQNPDGTTQMRRFYQSSLYNSLGIDLPLPTANTHLNRTVESQVA